ncbi:TetR/AcrR family transcriptional regulator [Microbacterium protaetiae]|uniref:TetR/AcrR family transcriptional regulator n=1 Tax=Microbacterium protaetiae TaxID=2509458 RepID=A0A4P6EPM3_9MICO|nr:TetR/AcrR family transcriptional regulator [Microbacterium protaetiae]QAY59928.1 TetR/AcrR family transcriptional regulator [Microbacterium protaetiae]
MPRPLDVAKRKADIARIAFDVLAQGGPSGLTIQAVAKELGGSVTKVTHIYPTRAELMRGTIELFVQRAEQTIATNDRLTETTEERLRIELLAMIPVTAAARLQERGRVALISDRDQESARVFADEMERFARTRLRAVLLPLIPEDRLEIAIDFCRSTVNGISLSTVEHPDYWTQQRQEAILNVAIAGLTRLQESGSFDV